jgi:hypothetical protein
MPETPFEEKVRRTLREQADRQPFDPHSVRPTAKRARRRMQRDAIIAAGVAVIALVALLRVGGPFMDRSTPAGPSPTPRPSEFSAGPASKSSGFQVSYDATDLMVQGVDPSYAASAFRIQFFQGYGGEFCVAVLSVDPAGYRGGNATGGTQEVRDCFGRGIHVGTGFGIGQAVMMFGPSESSSATAISQGEPQETVVLDPPPPFIDRLSRELGHPFIFKVLVVNTPVDGGRLVARDAAGHVLSVLQLPKANLNS